LFEYFRNEAFEYVIQPFRKAIQCSSIETPAERLTYALRHSFASHSCKQPHPESTSSSLHAASTSFRTTHVAHQAQHIPVTASYLLANITTQKIFIYLFTKLFKSYSNTCHYIQKTYASFSIAGR